MVPRPDNDLRSLKHKVSKVMMAVFVLLVLLGSSVFPVLAEEFRVSLDSSAADLYSPQNPLRVVPGDDLILACTEDGPVYRLETLEEYNSCTSSNTSSIIGLCDVNLPRIPQLIVRINFQSDQVLDVVNYPPGRVYYFAAFTMRTEQLPPGTYPSGEHCTSGLRMAMYVSDGSDGGGGTNTDSGNPGGTDAGGLSTPEPGDLDITLVIIIVACCAVGLLFLVIMIIVLVVVIRVHKRKKKNSGKVKDDETANGIVKDDETANGIILTSNREIRDEPNDSSGKSCAVEVTGKKFKKGVTEVCSKNGSTKITEQGKRVSLPTSSNTSAVSYRNNKNLAEEIPDGPRSKNQRNGNINTKPNAGGSGRREPPNPLDNKKDIKKKVDGTKSDAAVSGRRKPPDPLDNNSKKPGMGGTKTDAAKNGRIDASNPLNSAKKKDGANTDATKNGRREAATPLDRKKDNSKMDMDGNTPKIGRANTSQGNQQPSGSRGPSSVNPSPRMSNTRQSLSNRPNSRGTTSQPTSSGISGRQTRPPLSNSRPPTSSGRVNSVTQSVPPQPPTGGARANNVTQSVPPRPPTGGARANNVTQSVPPRPPTGGARANNVTQSVPPRPPTGGARANNVTQSVSIVGSRKPAPVKPPGANPGATTHSKTDPSRSLPVK